MKNTVSLFVTAYGSKVHIEAPKEKAEAILKSIYPGIEVINETVGLETEYEPKN